MADAQVTTLYEQDFYLWALEQARAVRDLRDEAAHHGNPMSALGAIDWENVVEELEGLAKRDQRELQSRMITIVEHLVKLELSTAVDPRAGWQSTIRRERRRIELLLRQSPSLRRTIMEFLGSAPVLKTADETVTELMQLGETSRSGRVVLLARRPNVYSETQILDDWWPRSTESDQ